MGLYANLAPRITNSISMGPNIIASTEDATGYRQSVNASAPVTNTVDAAVFNQTGVLTLGANSTGLGTLNAHGEVLLFNTISATDRDAIVTNQRTFWGTP